MFTRRRIVDSTLYIPARNESSTIGEVVGLLREAANSLHQRRTNIVVVDDRSTDNTAILAKAAGASVISTESMCVEIGGSLGKGDAIWASLRHCETPLIGWVDGDLSTLSPSNLLQMFEVLRKDSSKQLVKARFDRVQGGSVVDRGRVTMLTAIPLLDMLFPAVGRISEPLSGMFAGRTEVLSSLWLDCDYGVDIGIVLDIASNFGTDSIAELYVGQLEHRNRSLIDLSETARQVARAIISRSHSDSVISSSLDFRRFPPRERARQLA